MDKYLIILYAFSFQFNFIFLEATVKISNDKDKSSQDSCDKAKLIRIGDKQESFILIVFVGSNCYPLGVG